MREEVPLGKTRPSLERLGYRRLSLRDLNVGMGRSVARLRLRLLEFGDCVQVAELLGGNRLDTTVFPDDDGCASQASSFDNSGGCQTEGGIRLCGKIILQRLICHLDFAPAVFLTSSHFFCSIEDHRLACCLCGNQLGWQTIRIEDPPFVKNGQVIVK